ncbi:MAG: response regulator, partial [Bryobacteraceae bacterium]
FLLEIINDILDFSKIEAGKPELSSVDFSPRACVEEVLEMLFEMAEERKIELLCHFDDEVPDALCGDPGRLRQVITNLVGNALKFTEQGEVVIKVSCKNPLAAAVLLEFDVSDTGIGITPEQMTRIFEPFCQGDGSTTRKYGGTGLGLNISRRIAESMNGSITVTSKAGSGSTFHFTARFENQLPGVTWTPPSVLKDLRVLVVEDNRTGRLLLMEKARTWGMHPLECGQALEALSILRHYAATGEPINFALVDCQMPGLDGIDFVQSVRTDESLTGLQLVLATNFGHRSVALGDWDRTIAGVITKPIRGKMLLDILLQRRNPPPVAREFSLAASVTEPAFSNHRVLVAEDNLVNQKVASRMVEKLGYTVDVVANGHEVLLALERQSYSLILMDCQMPVMDGFEATAEIRKRGNNVAHIPVIAMTAHAMKGDRERCMSAGMDDYLTKPVNPEELVAVLNRWLPQDVCWTEAN